MEVLDMSLSSLWKLQNLYLERLNLEQGLNPAAGKELHREKEQILASLAALSNKQEEIDREKRFLKKQEDKYAELTAKRKIAEENLYSGVVQNPKELENIQQQIKQLKQDLDLCEEDFLTHVEKVEQELKDLEQKKRDLNKQKQEYKLKVDNYLSSKKQLEKRIEQLRQEIKELEETIDSELLLFYNSKKQHFGLRVLSRVDNKTCSTCHMVIPSLILKEVKQEHELVSCENCGRILYCE